jgi:quercetin dioxygenase-like cupin family protein
VGVATPERTDEFIEDPVLRYRYRFESDEAGVLRVEVLAEPGGGATVYHFHPSIEERWHVLEGEVTFTVEGEERKAGAGEKLTAAPGVRHSFENTGSTEARLVVEAEPAGRLREFLTNAARLAEKGRYDRKGRPKGIRGLLEGSDFAMRYRDTSVTTFPPPAVQRILMPPLAWLGRRLSD